MTEAEQTKLREVLSAMKRMGDSQNWKPYVVEPDEVDDGWRTQEHECLEAMDTLRSMLEQKPSAPQIGNFNTFVNRNYDYHGAGIYTEKEPKP